VLIQFVVAEVSTILLGLLRSGYGTLGQCHALSGSAEGQAKSGQ
jgi:hypothetical protein